LFRFYLLIACICIVALFRWSIKFWPVIITRVEMMIMGRKWMGGNKSVVGITMKMSGGEIFSMYYIFLNCLCLNEGEEGPICNNIILFFYPTNCYNYAVCIISLFVAVRMSWFEATCLLMFQVFDNNEWMVSPFFVSFNCLKYVWTNIRDFSEFHT